MHRQGKTDLFDTCPICEGASDKKRRIDVRDGVWFECCPACFNGIRTAMQGRTPTHRHPALDQKRQR